MKSLDQVLSGDVAGKKKKRVFPRGAALSGTNLERLLVGMKDFINTFGKFGNVKEAPLRTIIKKIKGKEKFARVGVKG